MNPFLEIPIVLVEDKEQKGKGFFAKYVRTTERKHVTLRARPGEIESYHSNFHIGTQIIMKSGKKYWSSWSFDEMDQALTSYNDVINSKTNKGRFGNVVINPPKQDKVALKKEEPKLEKV